jgi:hypothetical protein
MIANKRTPNILFGSSRLLIYGLFEKRIREMGNKP